MAKEPFLKEGMRAPEVTVVKQILLQQGFWTHGTDSNLFGAALTKAVTYFQQTHINQHGKPCEVDGKVGSETWWALKHPSGPSQRNRIEGIIPTGLPDERRRLLEVALKEHGAKEEPNGSNRGPRIDKYLPSWCLTYPGPPWCCFAYSWVCKQALGYYPTGRREGSCTAAYKRAKKQGVWIPRRDSNFPIPGNAFVMIKGGGKGHIGFVLRVEDDGSRINTIEGNCGNRFKVGLRDVDKRITGYIDVCGDSGGIPIESFDRGVIDASDVGHATTR